MFKAKIDIEVFKEFISSLMIVVEEINLNITGSEINARAVDVANVSMISSSLKREAFESYYLENENDIRVGLDLLKVYDILNNSSKKIFIQIEIDNKSQKLFIKYENLVYSTSLLDPSTIRSEPNVPTIDFICVLCISGSEFKRAVKSAERINDYIILGLKNNKFYLEAKNETDNVNFTIEAKILELSTKKTYCSISSIYSIDYLLNLIKIINKIDHVRFSIGQDYPLLVNFNFSNNFGTVLYFLAPRIESE